MGLGLGRIGISGEKGEQFGARETRRGRRAAERERRVVEIEGDGRPGCCLRWSSVPPVWPSSPPGSIGEGGDRTPRAAFAHCRWIGFRAAKVCRSSWFHTNLVVWRRLFDLLACQSCTTLLLPCCQIFSFHLFYRVLLREKTFKIVELGIIR